MLKSTTVIALSTLGMASILTAGPIGFVQTNLASDVPGVAPVTDPNLVNAWGIAASSASPQWIGDNGTGTSVLYNGAGVKQGLIVTIPGDGTVTGVAFAGVAGSFNGDAFLFDSEDGTVSGWRSALGTAAETLQTGSSANVYKGLTDATIGGVEYAYLANFRTGAVDVIKGDSSAPNLTGNFVDPNLPAGYAPFDVRVLGSEIYVTYAVQDPAKHDDQAGAGNGIVSVFDLNGNFERRLVNNGGVLNSPWGLALAPSGFGDFGGDLLVGNFGDGRVYAFNPNTGTLAGTLTDAAGNPIAIDGLWSLSFGNGGAGGATSTLFFTAGPDGESHGLFGELTVAPEPATWMMNGLGLSALRTLRGAAGNPRHRRTNVSQPAIVPRSSPRRNHDTRCWEEPWVNRSGATRIPAARAIRSSSPHGGGRREAAFYIACLEDIAILRAVAPHSGKAIGLQFEPHRQDVPLLRLCFLLTVHFLFDTKNFLYVMANLVGQYVSLRESVQARRTSLSTRRKIQDRDRPSHLPGNRTDRLPTGRRRSRTPWHRETVLTSRGDKLRPMRAGASSRYSAHRRARKK